MTERAERIALANAVRDALPYPRDWFALSWFYGGHEVIGRIQRGGRFEYLRVPWDEHTFQRLVEWAQADNPSTS